MCDKFDCSPVIAGLELYFPNCFDGKKVEEEGRRDRK
jgi:hypothetical protein